MDVYKRVVPSGYEGGDVIPYTKPMQGQSGTNPRMEVEIGHEIPSLAMELLPGVSCWERSR